MGPDAEGAPYHVYLIRDPFRDSVVKVGVTRNPQNRLRSFQNEKWFYGHSALTVEMRDKGVAPTMLLLAKTRTRAAACKLEVIISASLRVAGLTVLNKEGAGRAKAILSSAVEGRVINPRSA
jgi:hypothetical protein